MLNNNINKKGSILQRNLKASCFPKITPSNELKKSL